MNVSLYQAAAAMNANSRWQELISENLAASSIPGSRKQDVSFSSVEAGLASGELGPNGGHFAIPAARSSINFSQGELTPSGVATDFAIEGPGFFQVQLPNGDPAFTRDGEFHITSTGQLMTKRGYLVAGDNGPLQLDPNSSGQITVSATGDVSQGGDIKGHIRLAEFKDPHQLRILGAGYFGLSDPKMKPGEPQTSQIRQGYVESSNTSPTSEMSSLITAMRMFESNQKVLQMQDDRMGKVISDLGGTS